MSNSLHIFKAACFGILTTLAAQGQDQNVRLCPQLNDVKSGVTYSIKTSSDTTMITYHKGQGQEEQKLILLAIDDGDKRITLREVKRAHALYRLENKAVSEIVTPSQITTTDYAFGAETALITGATLTEERTGLVMNHKRLNKEFFRNSAFDGLSLSPFFPKGEIRF